LPPVWITLAGTVAIVVWEMVFWRLLAGPVGVFHQPVPSSFSALFQPGRVSPACTFIFPRYLFFSAVPSSFSALASRHTAREGAATRQCLAGDPVGDANADDT
jgi:hypothetical protein